MALAVWGHDVLLIRDVGGDKDKLHSKISELAQTRPHLKVLLRFYENLWKSEMDYQGLATVMYQDCINRRGEYGDEI